MRTKKTVWALVIFLVLSTLSTVPAFARDGEWESSGAPPAPHVPPVIPTYNCEIKVSMYSETQNLVIYSRHVLDTGAFKYFRSDIETKMTDEWYRKDLHGQIVPFKPTAETSWLAGQTFSISFSLDRKTGAELDHLWVTAKLAHGEDSLSSFHSQTGSLTAPKIESRANIAISQKDYSNTVQLNVGASCSKSK